MSMTFPPQEEQLIQITLIQDAITINQLPVGGFRGYLWQIDSIWVYWTTLEKSRMMVTIQLHIIINCIPSAVYINSTKQYPVFMKFLSAKFIKFKHCGSNLSLPAQAKFHYFPFLHACHVSPHSRLVNICIVTQWSLFTRFLLLPECILCECKFSQLIENKDMGKWVALICFCEIITG